MKRTIVLLVVGLALAGGVAVGLFIGWPGGVPKTTTGASTDPGYQYRGAANALIVIHEVSDFQCPYCARAGLEILPQVEARYEGKVKVVFHHNPLPMHQMAVPASMAALSAAVEGRFWPMHDWLFKNMKGLTSEKIEAGLKSVGVDAGRASWDGSDPRLKSVIERDQAVARALKIQGTPMFVINGKIIRGAKDVQTFADVIDPELAKAEALIAAGTPIAEVEERLSRENGAPEDFIRYWVKNEPYGAMPKPEEKKN